ncbi:MAG: DUF2236 domain-containing protein [Rhizobiales bacterium]|nr:DUF2236 domain-containing protein [Hyphomicrobiales bacterium]
MTELATESLWAKVESQKTLIPSMYGAVDFTMVPERFAAGPDDQTTIPARHAGRRQALLADRARVELVRAYSMMGDLTADAYAGLMRQYGFKKLVAMLMEACDRGVENVADAPAELGALIRDMERKPDWLDMKLVEQGARVDRNFSANFSPFFIRGAFIATFMNKYAALPMAITNNLSSNTASRRVKETATFFSTSVLPGALERFGPGFKAAAMVRLMHSMVRANVLRRAGDWDLKVYGIPIPQVDQMPAGLIPIFLLSEKVLAQGRTEFTKKERARVELARYRCFLLGLPEELLADTPQGIVDLMSIRNGTLRRGFDDRTCGELLRATMAADLRSGSGVVENVRAFFERRVSKFFFVKSFMAGDRNKAAAIGVRLSRSDTLLAALTQVFLVAQVGLYAISARVPGLRDLADRRLVARIKRQLASYGHAHFTTDAANYRAAPVDTAAPVSRPSAS